ncbi:MAG: hypothetical protein ISS70_00110 [Phycisphaerae bacterium]|nr:hypothetical protein [Phycisphaerae bacterium]
MSRKLVCLMSFVFVLVLAGNAAAQPDPATVMDGHVYLLNDANFVDATVPDDSAVGLAGNIVGEPYLAEGLFGKALSFDGVDDGVHIPDSQWINVTNGPWPNRTVVTVFKCAHVDKPEKQTVFEEGGLTRGLTVYVHEGLVYVGGWNKAEYQWNPGTWISAPISSNEWHTVALVIRDGADAQEEDKFEMWMDGDLIGKGVGGQIYNHGNDNAIGYTKQNNVFHDGNASGNGWFFEGLVDEVWILNQALTPPELAAMAGTTWPYAYGPDPANRAELEEFSALLAWEAGDGAVSHDVYLGSSLDDVIAGAADTFLGNQPATSLFAADLVPETTYYWRVDEVSDADPNNPSIGEVWSFSLLPRRAYDPDPADGTMTVGATANLTWTPGWSPIMHQVYFGTDPDEVANAADAPLVMDVGYDTGELQPGKTYYWRIDEFYGAETVKGPVWSFTTMVYDQDTPFDYDTGATRDISLDLGAALDWTDPIARLAVSYTGIAGSGTVSVDEAAGTTTIVGRGADIWGTSDQFQYAYTTLTGNGSMTVKVDSLAFTDPWTKAGIMIRETLDAGSSFAMIAATGSNGVRFQARTMADQDADADDAVATAEAMALTAPVWIKIERMFPMINAYYSTDGVTFIPSTWNPQVIPMTPAPIHIGLAVTSHSGADTYAEAVFSELSSDGGVMPGPLTSVEIGGLAANSAEPMYLVLEDASGASAAVMNPDPAATQQTIATDFIVDLADFAIDRTAVTKVSLVIGDLDAPVPGGTGSLTIHNVRLLPALPLIVLVSGNHDYDADGVVDDFALRDLLDAQDYKVDYQPGNWTELDDDKIAALNAADLVIISRTTNSGDYNGGDEPTQWNSITTPMIVSSTHLVRNSRWKLLDTGGTPTGAPMMDLADGSQIQAIDETVGVCSFPDIDAANVGNGVLLASGGGWPWIVEWEAGVEYYAGAGQTAGGPRVFFAAGTQEAEGVSNWGEWNLTADGEAVYLDTVSRLLGN